MYVNHIKCYKMELPVLKCGSLVKIVAVSELCYEGYIESDLRDA